MRRGCTPGCFCPWTGGGTSRAFRKRLTPDYVCLHGRHRNFLLEVKRPGGTLNPDQVIQIAVAREQFDLKVAVVSSTDELSEWLAAHERSP